MDIKILNKIKEDNLPKILKRQAEFKDKKERLSDFYKKQKLVALQGFDLIEPDKIEDYIAIDGYRALHKVLTEMSFDEVIKTIKDSGLRGRGGAGFPTGLKWEMTKAAESNQKYIVCNADEGDPGAFMDRSILEGNPHSVIEAMIIAGYAIGSNEGYIYVRAEYPLAGERLQTAIGQAKELGLLGENILNGFTFNLSLKYGAGAFVCGEETALISSIEGRRGEPTTKPPYPAEKGLYNQPTLINNVETFANITQIILNGADWFKTIGTKTSTGTKVFAVSGKINYSGIIELPMGTTLREIIYDVCGGIPNGKKFKAVQIGGPSGSCIPEQLIDTPIDYDNLKAIGSMMGSGGLIVLDEDSCMVDVAKFFLDFTCDESCGKCTPCRIGNKRLLEILSKITSGNGEHRDIELLEELSGHIIGNSLCGLGQSSPNPVLSTLKYFKDEYLSHITSKKCPAKVCKSLTSYVIDKTKCVGCSLCARVCPTEAISGDREQKYTINQEKCIKCGKCYENCRFNAIDR